jgi:multidrug efflux pump subunit AcrA (membrane-fusion protein)
MEVLREALQLANQARDAAVAQQATADAARLAAENTAAQAVADVATAQAATTAANLATAAARAAPATGPVVFAMSPALATSAALLNYNSSEGIKIYNKATTPMEALYDGGSGNLRLFLSKIQQKGNQYGWNRILTIQQGTQSLNLISSYGQVTLSSVRTQAYTTEHALSRDTQNSSQMYLFLRNSITDGLLGRVISRSLEYTSLAGFEDGPSLLKVIVTISHVDTRAQSGYIRQCLA